MDHQKTKEKATALSAELQDMLRAIPRDIEKGNRLYSRGEWHCQLAKARAVVRETLSEVFGDEEKAGVPDSQKKTGQVDPGYWGDLLTYVPTSDAPYAQSVLFAYHSVDGRDPFPVQDVRHRAWRNRDNLFYKGRRWSNAELKRNFYHYFDMLRDMVGVYHVPVRYWVTNSRRPHLVVTPSLLMSDAAAPGSLPMPCFSGESEWKQSCSCTPGCALGAFFARLWDLKEKTNAETSVFDLNKNSVTLDSLRKEYKIAWQHARKCHRTMLDNWVTRFQDAGVNRQWGTGIAAHKAIVREVFKVVTIYQYHDTPYVINLFQPVSSDGRFKEYPELTTKGKGRSGHDPKRAWTWLAITHEMGKQLDRDAQEAAAALANACGYLYVIEDRVTDNYEEELGYQLKYERWYHDVCKQYETLGEVVKTVLSALCRKARVSTQPVISRVKTCDSLFEKVVKRANGREQEVTEADRKKLFRAIRDGKHDELPRQIHDVVGVRVICAVHSDVLRIVDLLEKEITEGRLNRVRAVKDLREWAQVKTSFGMRAVFDYRSVHYWVSLSGDRLNMPENKPLEGLTCEIQLRSVLAHGWADVAHDVYYKSGIPEELLETNAEAKKVREILQGCAQSLKLQDDELAKARDTFEPVLKLHGVVDEHGVE